MGERSTRQEQVRFATLTFSIQRLKKYAYKRRLVPTIPDKSGCEHRDNSRLGHAGCVTDGNKKFTIVLHMSQKSSNFAAKFVIKVH